MSSTTIRPLVIRAGGDTPPRRRRAKPSTVTRIATWSARHPWSAILLWLAFVALTFVGGSALGSVQATDADLVVGEAGSAARIEQDGGLQAPATENILITMREGALDTAAATAAADALQQRLEGLPEVGGVVGPIPSDDGTALLVVASMSGDADTAADRVQPLIDATAAVQRDVPSLRIEEVGDGSIRNQFQEWLDKDITKATSLSVPATLVILLVAFGAVVMAGIPVLLALASVCSALGLWAAASHLIPDPGMVVHVLVLMGMAVGVDYSLFYLRRFREERATGQAPMDAVDVAAATSGHAVVVSGIAVILSMTGLYLAQDVMFGAMATGAILVVAVALMSSVTVLPALLVTLGRYVDRPRLPFLERLTNRAASASLVSALLRPVLRHPRISAVTSLVVLVALAVPALGISLKATQVEDFPRSLSTMQSYDRMLEAYPDNANVDLVGVEAPADQAAAVRTALEQLAQQTQGSRYFGAAEAPAFSADGTRAVLRVAVPYRLDTPEAQESVRQLRTELVPGTVGSVPGATYAVGGDVASDMDYTTNLREKLLLVLGFVLVLTFLIMYWAFRSVVVSAVTVLLNLLSCGAAFGVLVLVFQNTWAEGLLGFESTGHVVSWIPMLLFVVLSGLSLDYHVFVVSRIKEDALSRMTTTNAVASGITRTAGVVTSAAIVMIAVFSIFGTLSFIELKQIGVGLAVAILLDATLIRIVALPSLLTLLGPVLWWPGRRDRRSDRKAGSAVGQRKVITQAHSADDRMAVVHMEGHR